MSDALALIWMFYGDVAAAIFNTLSIHLPDYPFFAFCVASMWPAWVTLPLLWAGTAYDDRRTLRKIRRQIKERTTRLHRDINRQQEGGE